MDIQLRTGNFLDSRKVPKPYYKIYSLNLKFPLCQKAVTYFIYMYCKVASINACYNSGTAEGSNILGRKIVKFRLPEKAITIWSYLPLSFGIT